MNIIKIKTNKKNKLNSNSIKERKTDMDITEKLSSTFTTEHKTKYSYTLVEQHFYDGTQNSIQLHFDKQNKGVKNLKTAHEKGTRNQKIRRTQNYVMKKKTESQNKRQFFK